MITPLNDHWQISSHRDGPFTPIALPHDWLIETFPQATQSSERWYKREIDTSALKEGGRLYIRFDGVYQHCTLYVNGMEAGTHYHGYTTFHYDITRLLDSSGTSVLLLHVRYSHPSGRWYTGAGIYRNVSQLYKGPCHFAPDGIYVSTYLGKAGWQYEVTEEVIGNKPFAVRHTLLDRGEPIEAWDIDNPKLYQLQSELFCDNKVMDTVTTTIGFRSFTFDSEKGFFLNGKHHKLKGVCLHHDLGPLGAAMHRDALERQLSTIKAMGANAVRTAHNPPARELMEVCDELGLLVINEYTDVWVQPKNTYDYSSHFLSHLKEDAPRWIRRDRNHPSLLLWSLGNEVSDTHTNPEGAQEIIRTLMRLVKESDPRGNAEITLASNYLPWEPTQSCADLVGIVGYNYGHTLYEEHRRRYPHWVIYGSETCSTVQSRGIYHFPYRVSSLSDDDLQCSALGNGITSWGAPSIEAILAVEEKTPYSLGQFIWAGCDYLGEPTPYHTKSSYLGHIDTAGFPKDSYYLFQAAWSNEAVLHLFPYWDFNEGQLIDVRVYSNAHSVELLVNDNSQGVITLDGAYSATWSVPYQKGSIEAVSYDESGTEIKRVARTSFGEAERLQITKERFGELTFATIEALDGQNRIVENARCRVEVTVEGGELLALDSGDPTDPEGYRRESAPLFSGKLLAIVSGKDPTITATLDTKSTNARAIRLHQKGWQVHATILPETASDQPISWRLADEQGAATHLAELTPNPSTRSVTINPKGDGVIYLRAGVHNSRDHIVFYSLLEIPIRGFGKPYRDPYSYICGTWYDRETQELTPGNERGVATLRDSVSVVRFTELDFGAWGSDTLTLSLFPLSAEAFEFTIQSSDEVLAVAQWEKGTIWNTYQEETYTLKRRLQGVTEISFIFDRKVHLKGFQFAPALKAYTRLAAASCDTIVADGYRIVGSEIHGITNNASIHYTAMEFDRGVAALTLKWRSSAAVTVLQLLIHDSDHTARQLLHLPGGESWQEETFALNVAAQKESSVRLEFLPGTAIDLAWLHFTPKEGIDGSD
ncbi:MAG TPA: glycoside hydrolase family 2 TIM barrel-domain containing protein [Sphaerochaeta sp.]|nr:glycoside hydrolase family 2 TIM barrel-domain containing protein [Sphaerochaeta sp.]